MREAKIVPECTCGHGFAETGYGNYDRPIVTVFYPNGYVMFTNRDMDDDSDDLDLHCIRCGKSASWE